MHKRLAYLLFYSFISFSTFGQSNPKLSIALIEFTDWYNNLSDEIPPIYQGESYPLTFRARFGHQFFGAKQWQKGAVIYKNRYYSHIDLLFDIEDQQLVLKNLDDHPQVGIALDMKHISYFKLDSIEFIQLFTKNKDYQHLQLVYDGIGFDLLASHYKTMKLKSDGNYYEYSKKYLMRYSEDLIPLRSKKSLKNLPEIYWAQTKNIKNARFNSRKETRLVAYLKELDALSN